MITDAERMLSYIRQFVRPMAWRLREMGRLKELLEALDLPEFVRLDLPAAGGDDPDRDPPSQLGEGNR